MKAQFLNLVNISLERLNTDYVDILYLHNVIDPKIIDLQIYKDVFTQLKREDKIKYCGFTSHKNEIAVLEKAAKMDFYDVALIGISFKYGRREKIIKAMKLANDNGIGIIAMKTQGIVDWVGGDPETHHTAALKWALQDEYITCAIPGFTTFKQLEEDFSVAYDIKLNNEEKNYLKNYWENRTGSIFQCEQCLDTCPKNTDIPDLMRTYMYAAGYKNFIHSRFTYDQIPEEDNLSNCLDCKECTVECQNGLNIPANIKQLKYIYC